MTNFLVKYCCIFFRRRARQNEIEHIYRKIAAANDDDIFNGVI